MSPALLLLLVAVFAMLCGPLVHRRAEAGPWRPLVDGFALVTVAGLAGFHLIPEALHHGGVVAALCALVGLALPVLVERRATRASTDLVALVLVAGLVPHSALESAALGAASGDDILGLGAAIAAHRLPVALFVFSFVEQRHGARLAWASLGLLVVVTLAGFFAGESLAASLGEPGFAWLQALVGGSLLHVIFAYRLTEKQPSEHAQVCMHDHTDGPRSHHDHAHDRDDVTAVSARGPSGDPDRLDGSDAESRSEVARLDPHPPLSSDAPLPLPHHHPGDGRANALSSVGGVVGGLVILFALSGQGGHGHGHGHGEPSSLETMAGLALQSAPALLLAYVLVALLCASFAGSQLQWLARGGRLSQAVRGVLFGLPLPICACGVLPLYSAMIRRGVAPIAALAFLVATPALGLEALFLSIPLLGLELTALRVLAALGLALSVGLVVGGMLAPADPSAPSGRLAPRSHDSAGRLLHGLRFSLVELVDHTMPWVVAGLLLASWLEPLLGNGLLQGLPTTLQILLFTLLVIPLYVCAAGATPVAAMSIREGIVPGAGLAFLIAGPATNLTTFTVISRLHGRRVALVYGVVVLVGALGAGLVVSGLALEPPGALHLHGPLRGDPVQWACLGVLALLFGSSVWRQGPRGSMAQITQPIHHVD